MDRMALMLDALADQRNKALDALVQTQADLRIANTRIAELEAQLPKPDGAPDAGQQTQG